MIGVKKLALAIVLAIGPLPAQSSSSSQVEEILAQQSKMSKLTHDGYRLTPEQAASMEESLKKTPDDMEARARLLGFYFAPNAHSMKPEARVQARRRHILWLIANHPESALLALSEATVNHDGQYLGDSNGYEQVKKAWLEAVAKKDAGAGILSNAARFFLLSERELAADLYGRARKLEPGNPLWAGSQGSVMAFGIMGITSVNQNGFPDAADTKEAVSDLSKKFRTDLEASKDVDLLIAAASELMARGLMAQSMAQSKSGTRFPVDALGVAEVLLKRAEGFAPKNDAVHSGLARNYELRAITSTTDQDRKSWTSLRYDELRQGLAGLEKDEPASAQQLLTLARAAMDAGDTDGAQVLAKGLLTMLPKLSADPEYKRGADDIKHHSYIILGRVALRKGDIETAKADLLDAGRVGGGQSLAAYGPNMSLGKELLERGERDVVLQFLDLCRKFWGFPERLEPWIAAIKNGQIPDFGAENR